MDTELAFQEGGTNGAWATPFVFFCLSSSVNSGTLDLLRQPKAKHQKIDENTVASSRIDVKSFEPVIISISVII